MNDKPTPGPSGKEQIEATFSAALERPIAERPAFLEQACSGDLELSQQVRQLLSAYEAAGDFMPTEFPRSPEMEAQLARLKPEEAGERIANYKLLQEIGEGGFGVVWMAEQEAPVRRRVALKIIKLGMDTREVVGRFEQERQALAMMDHPNIAKVLDAGATASGRPYFVMELVRGEPITQYCDEHQLSPAERLRLFIQVCQAVQHAHQKGIIHRDLKPSNILVTVHDNAPVPKVIDFGVAKATQQRLTDLTFFTQFRQMIGTPAYMSPEQAEMSASLDIDTRSDIYSLGVLLYELLTGRTPFSTEELLRAGVDEIRRMIREDEPCKPSAALSSLSEAVLTTTAQRRSSQPPHLVHSVRGDLDWVVMKALEKDRTRRYATAEAFAADLLRHLQDEPVAARPPSAVYRFRKMARRHRTAFTAITAIVAVMFLALVLVTAAFIRVQVVVSDLNESLIAQHLAASSEERMSTAAARADAERSTAARMDEVSDRFFHEVLRAAAEEGNSRSLVSAVDKAVLRMGSDLSEQQLGEASLRHTIGTVYYHLGEFEKAAAMLLRSKELRCGYLPGSRPGELPIVARSLYSLAVVRLAQGKLDEAKGLLDQTLALSDPKFGPNGVDTADPLLVDVLNALGLVAARLQLPAEALTRHKEALALARSIESHGGWATVRSLRYASAAETRLGKPALAAPLLGEAEEIARHLQPEAGRTMLPHPAPGVDQ